MFLEVMGAIVLDALAIIVDDPLSRFAFFERFSGLTGEATGQVQGHHGHGPN